MNRMASKDGNVFNDIVDFSKEFPAGNEDHFDIGIVEDEIVVAFANGWVDCNVNGPDLHDGHVKKIPFRTVGRNGGDAITLGNAQLQQSVGNVIDNAHVVLRAVFYPVPVLLAANSILPRKFLEITF